MTAWILVLAGCGEPADEPLRDTAAEVSAPEPVVAEVVAEAPAPGAAPDGAELFARVWIPNDPRTPGGDGLGPRYNAESCAACHRLGGLGGAGGSEVNVAVESLVFEISTRFAPPIERATPALFGAGAIDQIPDDVLLAEVSDQAAGITGKVGRDADDRVARFGWKGDVATLGGFVERACATELGLETPAAHQRGKPAAGLDLDQASVDALVRYVAALPAPIALATPGFDDGRARFEQIGCAACHRAQVGEVDGLYSDLLIHDLGSDLADGGGGYYGGPTTTAQREWRTPPLWGLRDSAPYLHDGRARTIAEAVEAHGGEARPSVKAWRHLSAADRALVLRFLQSLAAPMG